MTSTFKYSYSNVALVIAVLMASLISYVFIWQKEAVNFVGGDAEYYYHYLRSSFISSEYIQSKWLSDPVGLRHHPIGVSFLLLPFFLGAYLLAGFTSFPLDGVSAPFQISISIAAIFYLFIGLLYFKKLCTLNNLPDGIIAITLLLLFIGTNLLHYTLSESGMSHVYSFCAISVFLYHSCKYIQLRNNHNLIYASFIFGLIIWLRPNNVFVMLLPLIWYKNLKELKLFFTDILKSKSFYVSILITGVLIAAQFIFWRFKEGTWFSDRYAGFGFNWLHPHFIEMLFGFNAGFFIYAPLCLLFLFGLYYVYKESKFAFLSSTLFLLLFFYFLSSYSAYTYFDGLGIRVLVDYYSLFGFFGAKLFSHLYLHKHLFTSALLVSLFLSFVSLVYFYQANTSILLRAGMNYNKWKYIFLKTASTYQDCLGGVNDLTPFSDATSNSGMVTQLQQPFNYKNKDYGLLLNFDSLNFNTNRLQVQMDITRTEEKTNASQEALICVAVENNKTHRNTLFYQFKLNETPSETCCEPRSYHYSFTANGDFKKDNRLSVFVWNKNLEAFTIDSFKVRLTNYFIH